jgi:thiol-disulfide isomerase/thioredoxin
MVKLKNKKVKFIIFVIVILFILAVGFFVGAGYSTTFLLNHFRDVHAGNVYEQISVLTTMRDGQIEDAVEIMDRRIINGLYSTTTSTPGGLPEDVSQWPESVLKCWQKAKEYFEEYQELLDGETQSYQVVRRLLEKVPDSERRIREKEFAEKYTGEIAPALNISKWFGQPTTHEQLRGKVVFLDFWGAWCGPCRRKLPHTQELYDKYNSKGLEVIGIHSFRDSETAGEFLRDNNYTFLLGIDTGETANNYSITSWPTYFLIDKKGLLVWGPKHAHPSEELIESLLSGDK